MREQPVCVRLKTDWMGNPSGSIVQLTPSMADGLFRSDAGEIIMKSY